MKDTKTNNLHLLMRAQISYIYFAIRRNQIIVDVIFVEIV